MRRSREEWLSGANRFSRPGEAFFGVFDANALVAVGGINRESAVCGRLRRFYVKREERRRRLGTSLALHLLGFASRHYARVVLRTDTDAAARFYVSIGFITAVNTSGWTHAIELGKRSIPVSDQSR
jgi:GNAT superfamily N-acetyltransferase